MSSKSPRGVIKEHSASQIFFKCPRCRVWHRGHLLRSCAAFRMHDPAQHNSKKETCKKQISFGAGDEARTRYLHLGKVALYRMSYTRIKWCLRSESNQRHADFQSAALPTELQRRLAQKCADAKKIKLATRNGLEPSTSSVTGWRANRLHHRAVFRTWLIIADDFEFVKGELQKSKGKAARIIGRLLERVTRLELATSTLARWRSTG